MNPVYVGCAGWSIQKSTASLFPQNGTHLERYAGIFQAVEINSSFYRPHRESTYAKWADSVPANFRFAAKIPRDITHTHRLKNPSLLTDFVSAVSHLKDRLGPLLVQLPPSLAFDKDNALAFFSSFRNQFSFDIVCEPRHPSWLTEEAENVFDQFRVARAATDPFLKPGGLVPGGWNGLRYYRLHGSPEIYYSNYSDDFLETLSVRLREEAVSAPVWCIFDNTAEGHAAENALKILETVRPGSVLTSNP